MDRPRIPGYIHEIPTAQPQSFQNVISFGAPLPPVKTRKAPTKVKKTTQPKPVWKVSNYKPETENIPTVSDSGFTSLSLQQYLPQTHSKPAEASNRESDSDFFSAPSSTRAPSSALFHTLSFASPRIRSKSSEGTAFDASPTRSPFTHISGPSNDITDVLAFSPTFGPSNTPSSVASSFPHTPITGPFEPVPVFHIPSPDSPLYSIHGSKRRAPLSRLQKAEAILQYMKDLDAKFTVVDLLVMILDSSQPQFEHHRNAFYRDSSTSVQRVLDCFDEHPQGRELVESWFSAERARSIICQRISDQMEKAKPHFRLTVEEFTPEFLSSFDLEKDVYEYSLANLPDWMAILDAAATSPASQNSKKRDTKLGRTIVTAQVMHMRSIQCAKVQSLIGLSTWGSTASKQTIEVLNHCELSTSWPTIISTVENLANRSILSAIKISKSSHMFNYDNMDISSSIHVEQTKTAVSKIASGTFPILYEATNVKDRNHMRVEPTLKNLRKGIPLQPADICPTRKHLTFYHEHTVINIIDPLIRRIPSFSNYAIHDELKHPVRRIPPSNHVTKFYPLPVTTQEEKTISGNLNVQEHVYTTILKQDPNDPELSKYLIPTINDQYTNARIRSCLVKRFGDLSPWSRREIFAVGIAIFHMIMNLIWALRAKHYGNARNPGSISFFFHVMEKKRLAGDKPDFYTLSAALQQILDGILLSAWRKECGDLKAFASTNPTPKRLKAIASIILHKYLTPLSFIREKESVHPATRRKKSDPKAPSVTKPKLKPPLPSASISPLSTPNPEHDPSYQNLRYLARDLLIIAELTDAVPKGDFGRIENLLPDLAAVFRGAGSVKYATEIMHLLHNLKYIWTPEFSDIMRDNHLVNISGLEGHWMAADMNIEHQIGYVKGLFAAKGIYASWDRLGYISAAIVPIQASKKKVASMLKISYQKKSHTDADTTPQVWTIIRAIEENQLLDYIPNRQTDTTCSLVPDLRAVGFEKLQSSLKRFNKQVQFVAEGMRLSDPTNTASASNANVIELDDDSEEEDELPDPEWGNDSSESDK
ncbi:hypothetical protein VKT23_008904 [Stygiomarasmius scandens]|uniref:DUF6589 domain-containing protein n=1 Tax=Marasmiellus scandens TaxID=2682957 RepID=A0ABR1JL67_9AGAR